MIRILKSILPRQLKSLISRHLEAERKHWINRKYSGTHLERNIRYVDSDTYQEYKGYQEAEHQIGRFLNMKKILARVQESGLDGDLVEFGTWQGQGLRLFDLATDIKMNKKMVGIDSFEGLPTSSTIWKKGAFSNTSLDLVKNRLKGKLQNFSDVKLIQGWFNDPSVASSLYEAVNEISIVHLDADLGSSTLEALTIIEPYLKDRKNPLYLLFDDWGCHPNEVPEAFNKWLINAEVKYGTTAEVVCFTNLTRYYELQFRCEA